LEIRTLIESIQFKLDANQSAIRSIEGYDVTFFPGLHRLKVVPYFTVLLETPLNDSLFALVQNLLPLSVWQIERHEDILAFHYHQAIRYINVHDLDVINQSLVQMVAFLKEHQVKQPSSCYLCQMEGYDLHYFDHCVHKRVHADCLAKQLESHKPPSIAEMCIDSSGHYLKSMVIMILFAFIFAIPAIFAVIYLPIFYAMLMFLVPLGCVIGYRIGRSVVNQPTHLLMNVTSYMTSFILIIWAWNYYAQINEASFFTYLFQTDNLSPFIFDLVVGSLFVSLGLWLAKKIMPIKRT